MIEAVKMDVEEQSGHLAESEVARLLAVLQNAEFKRSETRNITKDHSFKPRSLMEIAIEAQQSDAEIEAVKQAEEALAAAQRAEAASASKAQSGEDQNLDDPNSANPELDKQDPATRKNDGALMPADGTEGARGQIASPDNPLLPITGAGPKATPDMAPHMTPGDQSSDLSGNLANDALANDAAENGDGEAAEAAQIAANFETVTAAFERGKAEGMTAGRDAGITEAKAAAEAAAQANLADKIAAFEAALLSLAKPQALQAEDLSRSIHAAVLKLASQRAGQQIDDMPENFLARIEALVTSIGQKMTAGKVHINADDYRVMLPYLADTHFDFVAESGLARGDVILKFAGVELHDIAETRLGGQYAETTKTMVKAPKEPADLSLDKTPAETQPVETQPAEIQPVEKTPAESASAIRPMTTLRPLETSNDAADNGQDDKSLSSLETTQAESASAIRPMTTVRPLETSNDAADNAQDDKSFPSLEKTPAESASAIRPMTTVRPLETNDDAADNAQDDKSPPPLEKTPAESASAIRPMTTVRPLETNNDVTENDQDDQAPSPSDETSS